MWTRIWTEGRNRRPIYGEEIVEGRRRIAERRDDMPELQGHRREELRLRGVRPVPYVAARSLSTNEIATQSNARRFAPRV